MSTPTSAVPARPTSSVDELVNIGRGQLHVRCAGAGSATVVLVSGFTGGADEWPAVESALATRTRVCVYDRFGIGASDPPPSPQTFRTEAQDLRTLLEAIGDPGPFVIVGHSFGGAEAVEFASLFPVDTHALLLLDASPANWNDVVCSVDDPAFRYACGQQADPSQNPERLDAPTAFTEVGRIASIGAIPMIVATAPVRAGTDALPANTVQAVNDAWNAGQQHWVSLSSSAQFVVVPNTGHYIQNDHPAFVVEQIESLLR